MNSMQASCYKHEAFFYDILIPSYGQGTLVATQLGRK